MLPKGPVPLKFKISSSILRRVSLSIAFISKATIRYYPRLTKYLKPSKSLYRALRPNTKADYSLFGECYMGRINFRYFVSLGIILPISLHSALVWLDNFFQISEPSAALHHILLRKAANLLAMRCFPSLKSRIAFPSGKIVGRVRSTQSFCMSKLYSGVGGYFACITPKNPKSETSPN